MSQIADITDNELWIVRSTLQERYGELFGTEVELQLADSEIRLRLSDRDLTQVPVLFWEHKGCHFVIIKSGERRYRCQFYYRLYQQMGTGVAEYDDLSECVVSLLQVQADYEAKERGDI